MINQIETFIPKTSSTISKMEYDKYTYVLKVTFISGGIYAYYDVPITIWNSLKSTTSVGAYFAKFVKGIFRTTKLS